MIETFSEAWCLDPKMRGRPLSFVLVFAMEFGNWVLAESPPETALTRTNQISEVFPIKYALASDIASVLSRERNGKDTSTPFVGRALGTAIDGTTVYAQVETLGPTKITWDERVNYLVVTASAKDLAIIKGIISKLDVVLSQVLVEGVILQFPLDDRKDSPRSKPNAAPHLPSSFSALTNVSGLSTTRFTSVDATSKTNPQGSQLSYEATLTGDLDALITSLANNQGVMVLQKPRIQTSVGVPATMFVGSGRPYPGGSYTCGCLPSISSLDTGITIDVVCLLTSDGTVLTDIQTTVNKLAGHVTIQNVGDVPMTESYSGQAHVAVRDRQIIALGGLIQEEKTPLFSQVTALDKVPVAGHLLNRIITSPTHTKRYELMVLIRATILPVPEIQALAGQREDRMPGIKQLEQDILTEEANRLRAAE